MPALFALTLFASAALLFAVQPLLGKLLLPLLGGASSVWTTCMVFYQVILLAGYLYAHVVTNRLPRGLQAGLHVGLLVAAGLLLPFAIPPAAVESLTAGAPPVRWLLTQLLLVAGLPFFVVSTTGPLLQRWYSQLGHSTSADPYFLYSASNLGSLLALAAYPLWLELQFDVAAQSRLWHAGFLGLLGLIVLCGWRFARSQTDAEPPAAPARADRPQDGSVPLWQRARWTLLAFVPSSLMLGTTTYLTTDIASIPLLWVIPLGLYLLTFVIAFSRRRWLPSAVFHWLVPVLAIVLIFALLCRATEPVWVLISCHLLFLFVAAASCHLRLANDRPPAERLTEFYLWLAIGGALGGLFNALLAPLIFREVIEYPLLIVLASALYVAPRRKGGTPAAPVHDGTSPHAAEVPPFQFTRSAARRRWRGGIWLLIALPGLLAVMLGLIAYGAGWRPGMAVRALVFGVPTVLCFLFARRPLRFAAALAAVILGAQVYVELTRRTVFVDRSFFGVSRVTVSANGWFRQLDHGNTAHGRQFIEPSRACEPLAYYHREGPLGTIFREFQRAHTAASVGLIGLGAGATLAYARPGETWDIYEIDPLVIQIARDRELFSYLTGCSAVAPRIIEGDGRLQLARARDGQYGLLILDAFSSDAIPMHLLTVEAIELYFSKLADGGWLAMHVSNRYLDLEQVMTGLAQAKGYAGLSWIDTEGDRVKGKEESHWIVIVRNEADLRGLATDPKRIPLESRPGSEPWTDARSSLLPIFKW